MGKGSKKRLPKSIRELKRVSPDVAAEALRMEHPQITALALALAGGKTAGSVLPRLSERQRNDVLLRMATMDGASPKWIGVLGEGLAASLERAKEMERGRLPELGGAPGALAKLPEKERVRALDWMIEYDPELHARVVDAMDGVDGGGG